jgi:hypothetical protein
MKIIIDKKFYLLNLIWFLVFFAFDIHTYYDGAVVNLDKELYSKHCSILGNNEIFSLISALLLYYLITTIYYFGMFIYLIVTNSYRIRFNFKFQYINTGLFICNMMWSAYLLITFIRIICDPPCFEFIEFKHLLIFINIILQFIAVTISLFFYGYAKVEYVSEQNELLITSNYEERVYSINDSYT